MLSTFVKYWKTENTKEEIRSADVELIVPISFTTLRNKLTFGTLVNVTTAVMYKVRFFPDARIAFSSCSYPFNGAEHVEDELRTDICQNAGIKPIIAEPMVNTVDEAMNIREALNSKGINPKCILIVTGELHSPSARYIWKKLFPDAKILISCIPHHMEIQPNHLVLDQRTMLKWVVSNIKREIALRLLPLSFVRKIQHKAAN